MGYLGGDRQFERVGDAFLVQIDPDRAGSAIAVTLMIIVIKHLALGAIIGSPLFGVFQSIKPKLREHGRGLIFKLRHHPSL
jgi:hypothetical protein